MPPSYRYPREILFSILGDLLAGGRRTFPADAARLSAGISRLKIIGPPPLPPVRPLFLVNHFSRPGFRAWWIVIALGSVFPSGIHWVMTSAWTYPDPIRARLITPVSERFLARLARLYGFTSMPPMPPRPRDTLRRAEAVRRLLRIARAGVPAIGLAPEGMDSTDGRLQQPPPGAGRLIRHLTQAGYTLHPVGAYEEEDNFCLHFGDPFTLCDDGRSSAALQDREASARVMRSIAVLLPERLRGEFT